MTRTWKDIGPAGLDERCDVVVVGSGAGGGVAAYEAAAAGLDVVVLEEGGFHPPEQFTRDPLTTFAGLYRNGGVTATLGRPVVLLPMGRCLGGTTTVNSGTCFRLPEPVLEEWHRVHGLTALDPGELDGCFQRVEEVLGIAEAPRPVWGGNAETFGRGAEALGWSHRPLRRNAPGCRGSGVCVHGCPAGAKRSTLVCYLPMAEAAGARVYANCRVERVDLRNGLATGVSGRVWEPTEHGGERPGRGLRVAARAVVVCCGTVYTPVLLSASGLAGPSGALGRNLAIHPGARVLALMPHEVRGWEGVPQATQVDRFSEDGILMEGAFVVSGVMAPALPGFGERTRRHMANYRNLAAFGAMVHDTSRGRVVRIPGTLEPLTLYSLNETDTRRMHRGMVLVAEAFFAAGAVEVYPSLYGVEVLRGREELRAFAERTVRPSDLELMAFHPQGTCRMGADPRRSVLDSDCRHHQVANLYVADASVFPSPLGVNPMETIEALATRTARRMAARMS